MEIKIQNLPDGRFSAEYLNPQDLFLNGISQFGESAFEARINLQALINTVQRLRTTSIAGFNRFLD